MIEIYYFWAIWCGPCKTLGPMLESLTNINNIKLTKIDIDNEPELAVQFKLKNTPTIILLKDGQEIKRLVGLVLQKKLQEFVDVI